MFSRIWKKIKSFFSRSPVINDPVKPIDLSKLPRSVSGSSNGKEMKRGDCFADVSRYAPVDFTKFIGTDLIFKATQGAYKLDKTLAKNITACQSRGIRWGAYHFYECGVNPINQAKFFIDSVGYNLLTKCHHLPIVDYEKWDRHQNERDLKNDKENLLKFCECIFKNTGRKVRIYTGDWLMSYLEFDNRFLEFCDLPWIANYSKKPINFGPWGRMWAWQFAAGEDKKFKVAGIGWCDGNKFYGN
jgi:GH25 family lysozyme M1 (1,4-beta-N-acetylmuramidase)